MINLKKMALFRFSTQDFSVSERVNAFQEVYASIANIDIDSSQQHPPFVEMVGRLLPNLGVYETIISPHSSRRTRAHVATENNDNLALVVPIDNTAIVIPENEEPLRCLPGEAVLIPSHSIHQALNTHTMSIAVIVVPTKLIATRASDLNKHLMKKFSSANAPEIRLLVGYTRMLMQMKDDLSPELAALVATQIHDLFVLLCGAKQEEAAMAKDRGLRAARLRAVKEDIVAHITDSELSINQVALRQGISPQYIRALFHSEETTFADYVSGLRLEQTYRFLRNPLHIDRSISTLALDMGFNNISWFNRIFKQRFGLTPMEVRNFLIKR
ncbi:MAG: AraC family transcriptional regulator [Nitrosomonas sp. PRO4]|nr:AraC family transcriptional regulator [Nitrosomonas sp. PRO4]